MFLIISVPEVFVYFIFGPCLLRFLCFCPKFHYVHDWSLDLKEKREGHKKTWKERKNDRSNNPTIKKTLFSVNKFHLIIKVHYGVLTLHFGKNNIYELDNVF